MKTIGIAMIGLVCVSMIAAQGVTNVAQGGTAAQAPVAPAATRTDPAPAAAEKIGVFNVQDAIKNCQEGKKLIADLNTKYQPKSDAIAKEEQDIQSLQTQLNNGKQTMSEDAQTQLSNEIQSKQRDVQQEQQNVQQDAQQDQSDIIDHIGSKMMPIINKYAAEHGYTMIVDVSFGWPQNPVLYAASTIDITSDIVKLYDQQYPASATTAPAAKPAGPGRGGN